MIRRQQQQKSLETAKSKDETETSTDAAQCNGVPSPTSGTGGDNPLSPNGKITTGLATQTIEKLANLPALSGAGDSKPTPKL